MTNKMIVSLPQLVKDLELAYTKHESVRTNGGTELFWADGVTLNVTRNLIISTKDEIADFCRRNNEPLPDAFKRPTPQAVDDSFMVKAIEIKEEAQKRFDLLSSDRNFRYLKNIFNDLSKAGKKKISYALNVVEEIKKALDGNDLVTLRRTNTYDLKSYLNAFEVGRFEVSEEDFCPQVTIYQMAG